MDKTQKMVAGRVTVETMYSKNTGNKDSSVSKELEVRTFPEGVEPAWIEVSQGLTINLGQYESARVDASVKLPCFVEEIRPAFGRAWALVESELKEAVSKTPGEKTLDRFEQQRSGS